jgi:hypothetical protein
VHHTFSPINIKCKVFSYFNVSDLGVELVECSRTCHQWREIGVGYLEVTCEVFKNVVGEYVLC